MLVFGFYKVGMRMASNVTHSVKNIAYVIFSLVMLQMSCVFVEPAGG